MNSSVGLADYDPSELRKIAVRVASEAAALLRDLSFEDESVLARTIAGETTQVDLEAENYIIGALKEEIGKIRVVTEEQGTVGEGEITAVVDPLDGSKNYLNKIPWASVSIAIAPTGGTLRDVVAGAVAPIFYGDPISFAKGRGCYLGEKRVEKRNPPEKFIFVYIEQPDAAVKVASLIGEIGRGYKVRSLGSAALELSYTGIGRGTGFFDFRSKLRNVDIAAAMGVILECNGEVLDSRGHPLNVGLEGVARAGTVIAVAEKDIVGKVKKVLS